MVHDLKRLKWPLNKGQSRSFILIPTDFSYTTSRLSVVTFALWTQRLATIHNVTDRQTDTQTNDGDRRQTQHCSISATVSIRSAMLMLLPWFDPGAGAKQNNHLLTWTRSSLPEVTCVPWPGRFIMTSSYIKRLSAARQRNGIFRHTRKFLVADRTNGRSYYATVLRPSVVCLLSPSFRLSVCLFVYNVMYCG